jgi:hypothetical protein
MSKEKKVCKVLGCERMTLSLGKRGGHTPHYSNYCKRHQKAYNRVDMGVGKLSTGLGVQAI